MSSKEGVQAKNLKEINGNHRNASGIEPFRQKRSEDLYSSGHATGIRHTCSSSMCSKLRCFALSFQNLPEKPPSWGKEMMMGTPPKSEKAGTELRRNSCRTGSFRKSSVTTLLKRYPSHTELSTELELTLGANDMIRVRERSPAPIEFLSVGSGLEWFALKWWWFDLIIT